MIEALRRTSSYGAFALVVAGVGCGPSLATVTATAPTAAPGPLSSNTPTIAGTVVLHSTGAPSPAGGVVYLEDAPKVPGVAATANIDVHHKEFTPFITVVTTGGTVTFGNEDALTHHVFSPDVKGWDTGYLGKSETSPRRFDQPGAISLLCNIHPEMLAYVLVIPSSYFGRFGADGRYVIANVPPGTYKLTAWSPRLPSASRQVTVSATGVATADFDLQAMASAN